MPIDPAVLARKASRVRLLLLDVDGVMTDGRIALHSDGSEAKLFHIRDGTGIVWAQRAGIATGLISARQSRATTVRAAQLGIQIVRQAGDKLQMYLDLLREQRVADEDVAFMGDDLLDLPVLSRVGLAAAPGDAEPEVCARVDWVSTRAGGRGAVRELVELILRAQGRWEELLRRYASKDAV